MQQIPKVSSFGIWDSEEIQWLLFSQVYRKESTWFTQNKVNIFLLVIRKDNSLSYPDKRYFFPLYQVKWFEFQVLDDFMRGLVRLAK